jgi:hypothetical protein
LPWKDPKTRSRETFVMARKAQSILMYAESFVIPKRTKWILETKPIILSHKDTMGFARIA